MDHPHLPLRLSCSPLGLIIVLLGLISMCHSAIKDSQPKYYPDHVATEFTSLDTNRSDKKQDPCEENCKPHSKMEVQIESLLNDDGDGSHEKAVYEVNRTTEFKQETDIRVAHTTDEHHWKVKIIIVCTIAASVEIIIVIFILIYWKDIRWTMRKMYCPCDERRVRRRDHEAMEPSGPSPSDSGFQGDDLEQGQHVQTYQARRRGETDPLEEQSIPLEEQPLQTSVV